MPSEHSSQLLSTRKTVGVGRFNSKKQQQKQQRNLQTTKKSL